QSSLLLLLCLLAAIHLGKVLMQQRRRQGQRRAPPGPFPWPLIGNAAQLGSAPHLSFARLASTYGAVFQLRLGRWPVVVLNGERAIRQALVRQGAAFAGRPPFPSFRLVAGGLSPARAGGAPALGLHPAQMALRGLGGKSRPKQLSVPFALGRARGVAPPGTHQWGECQRERTARVPGYLSRKDEKEKTNKQNKTIHPTIKPNPDITKPYLGSRVMVHKESLAKGSPVKPESNSFYQLHLIVKRRHNKSQMTPLLGKFGFFSRRSTCFLNIFKVRQHYLWYPNVQAKMQEEVDRIVGRDRLPCAEDQPHLPYIMAFLYESMRFSSFVPVTIPHATTTNTFIMGYLIPKDTVIFVNQWSVNHDPAKWSNPEDFDPTRFLDENGFINKDLTSSVMIFSLGKRRCIGEELSKVQLFLFTSILVHQCNFTANPNEDPKMDFTYGLTIKPKPFTLNVTLRDTMDLLDQAVQRLQAEKAAS
ncbi:Cytochrome P450 1B1, partial [Dryobates pubescens]